MATPWDRDAWIVWRTPSLWRVTPAAAATRTRPGTGDQRDRVRACLLVAVKQSPYRWPFVRDVHIGQVGGEAGIDHRTGLPGERPDRGQDHTDADDGLAPRRRVADIDGMHVRRRAIGGQSSSEILQWAAVASSQPDRQAAGGQLGRDEPTAVPRRPKQEHVAGHPTVTDRTDLGGRRHSTPLIRLT